jgi:hypothetical protein
VEAPFSTLVGRSGHAGQVAPQGAFQALRRGGMAPKEPDRSDRKLAFLEYRGQGSRMGQLNGAVHAADADQRRRAASQVEPPEEQWVVQAGKVVACNI